MHISSIRAGSFLLVVLGCLVSFGAARNSGLQKSSQISGVPDTASLNANRVLVMLNNRGSLDSRLLPAGGFWLYQQQEFPFNNPILYDAGIGLIGKIGGTVRLGLTQWGSSYAPGPIIDGKPALWVRPQDAARFRPYKISRGDSASSNPDYAEWPRDLGAPLDDQGMPKLYADQTIWMVYNDADSSARPMEWDRAAPFPHAALEIHQLAYSRRSTLCDSAAMLANVVFFEWTIINKEPAGIDSAFAIIWTDIDFLGADANIPAIDTLRQLPYCWDTDPSVGTAPPGRMAVGYMPLRGPILPSSNDTAIFRGTTRPGYRNLHMTSFWPILDDAGPDSGKFFFPARTTEHLWNVARGFDKDGPALVDPTTGQATKFPYGGDPVTGTGWVWQKNEGRGGGAGFYAFFGPFMMAPNDTQWLQAALVPALGKDHFDAIQVLRYQAEQLLTMPYDTLLSGHFNHIFCEGPFVPSAIQLFQNYPNPFNAGTKIAYDIDQPTHVRVTVYDLLGREIAVLIDGQRTPGRYSVDFTGRGLASGVYFYRLQTTTTSMTRKLVLLR